MLGCLCPGGAAAPGIGCHHSRSLRRRGQKKKVSQSVKMLFSKGKLLDLCGSRDRAGLPEWQFTDNYSPASAVALVPSSK